MDISPITDYLYIAAWPKSEDVEEIKALNVRLIVSMTMHHPPIELTQSPLHLLRVRTIDTPLTPIPIRALRKGVETALPVIQHGAAVLIHCRKGRHRSVAMAAAILIGTGHSAQDAMKLISERREAADPYMFYIRWRINLFEKWWHKTHKL